MTFTHDWIHSELKSAKSLRCESSHTVTLWIQPSFLASSFTYSKPGILHQIASQIISSPSLLLERQSFLLLTLILRPLHDFKH
jgi:hypothetical protein